MPPPSKLGALSRIGAPTEVLRLAHCVLFAAAVPLLMRVPLKRLEGLIGRPAAGCSESAAGIDRVVQDVGRALRYGRPLVRRGCLTRGVTLYHFLRRAGVNVQLCFGARYRGGQFEAHCWLERDGKHFLEQPGEAACFQRIYSFSGDYSHDV